MSTCWPSLARQGIPHTCFGSAALRGSPRNANGTRNPAAGGHGSATRSKTRRDENGTLPAHAALPSQAPRTLTPTCSLSGDQPRDWHANPAPPFARHPRRVSPDWGNMGADACLRHRAGSPPAHLTPPIRNTNAARAHTSRARADSPLAQFAPDTEPTLRPQSARAHTSHARRPTPRACPSPGGAPTKAVAGPIHTLDRHAIPPPASYSPCL